MGALFGKLSCLLMGAGAGGGAGCVLRGSAAEGSRPQRIEVETHGKRESAVLRFVSGPEELLLKCWGCERELIFVGWGK